MQNATTYTHKIMIGGEEALLNNENFREVCDRLTAKHLGHTPVVVPLSVPPSRGASTPPPSSSGFDAGGKARSDEGRAAIIAAGFSPAQPLFRAGTRVNELGVENASKSRLEWERLPSASSVCHELMAQVAREQRRDVLVDRLFSIRMNADGTLHRGNASFPITEDAFGMFLSRTEIGGHAYLRRCPTALRSVNVNHWMQVGTEAEQAAERALASLRLHRPNLPAYEPRDAKLRTRMNGERREVFAVTGGSYAAFDVDKIAQAISLAAPSSARGSVHYDGTRARFEVLFHSDVKPENYVAGEFFKAGVSISTDDTGGGSIKVSAVVWQNLCLNLIILDECVLPIAALRHVGKVEKLAAKFGESFERALGAIDHFVQKWDAAVDEDVLSPALDAGQFDEPEGGLKIDDVLPGLFNGIIERELVPVRGERKQVVRDLVRMFEEDDSSARVQVNRRGETRIETRNYVSRAAVVNAFTRYAHKVNGDAFQAETIERSAGGLLDPVGKKKTLPFEPIDLSDKD